MADPNAPKFIEVAVSPPSPPAGSQGVFASDNVSNPHDWYTIETRYIWENGTVQLPIAMQGANASPLAASIVQLSSPYGLKVITWTAQRKGMQPILPDPAPDNANQALGKWEVFFHNDMYCADLATAIYKRSGYYAYLLLKPIGVKNGIFHVGNAPVFTVSSATVTASKWSASILSTGGGEGAG
jgi:hypothetical protein